jgi:hypothetical protein
VFGATKRETLAATWPRSEARPGVASERALDIGHWQRDRSRNGPLEGRVPKFAQSLFQDGKQVLKPSKVFGELSVVWRLLQQPGDDGITLFEGSLRLTLGA